MPTVEAVVRPLREVEGVGVSTNDAPKHLVQEGEVYRVPIPYVAFVQAARSRSESLVYEDAVYNSTPSAVPSLCPVLLPFSRLSAKTKNGERNHKQQKEEFGEPFFSRFWGCGVTGCFLGHWRGLVSRVCFV